MTKLSFDQMVLILRKYLDLEDQHYAMLLLFAIHVRIGPLLQPDFCPYILYVGNKESGKTNSTMITVEMCNGVLLSKCTGPYLLRKMDKLSNQNKCIGLDQLDDHLEALDELPAILETGHRWSATYGVIEKEKNKQVEKEINCGGPKVLNSLIPPKGTLRSRCYEIFTYPTKLAIQCSTTFPFHANDIKALSESLDVWADEFRKAVSLNMVETFLQSDEHHLSLEMLKNYGARRLDMANVFESLNHFLKWNVDVIGALSYEQGDDELDSFRDVLSEVATTNAWDGRDIKAREICSAVNRRYLDAGWKTLTETRFGILMANLGFGFHDGSKHRKAKCSYYSFAQGKRLLNFVTQTTIWGTAGLKK